MGIISPFLIYILEKTIISITTKINIAGPGLDLFLVS